MDHLQTETRNPASLDLDRLSSLEIVRLMNSEDSRVIPAVGAQAEVIAQAIDAITARLQQGGRLIYLGAGTSGRLGVLDATECPPTYSAEPGQVVGVIAGGPAALTRAVEGAEDQPDLAEHDLKSLHLEARDVLVGIATSGRTPYVQGGLAYARKLGTFTIGLSCNTESDLLPLVDLAITPVVGPEVLTGSTRLKAGTATKMVLNMLTTGAMVRLGKAYGNLMVDLKATNSKLRARTNRIVRQLTGLSHEDAEKLLQHCGGELKTALVARLAQVTPDIARLRLQDAGGSVRRALERQRGQKTENRGQRTEDRGWEGEAPAEPAGRPDLILGIDGGGSHTVALLARILPLASLPKEKGDAFTSLGRGESGPSNLQTVGLERALQSLDEAVGLAFQAAGLPRGKVGRACLGLAGAGRPGDQELIRAWADRVGLADRVQVTADSALLLAAGTPANWGIALVAGTGSMALGRTASGKTARAGGWGPVLGDEGSGYRLALAGLEAAVHAADRRGLATTLLDMLLKAMHLAGPADFVAALQSPAWDRQALAGLAPVVFQAAAAGDAVAQGIQKRHAAELAQAVLSVARDLDLLGRPVPLALAGGLLLGHAGYRDLVLHYCKASGLIPEPLTTVPEPVLGGLFLALSESRN